MRNNALQVLCMLLIPQAIGNVPSFINNLFEKAYIVTKRKKQFNVKCTA